MTLQPRGLALLGNAKAPWASGPPAQSFEGGMNIEIKTKKKYKMEVRTVEAYKSTEHWKNS